MPAATSTQRHSPNKKATRRSGARKLSVSHKRSLSEGRTMSATVNRYLAAVNTPKRRGRKVSTATLTRRLADARERFRASVGVDKVLAAQEVRDLQAKLAQMAATNPTDAKTLEAAFVKVAKQFSTNRGISYGAWREAGVSADVLKRAGIARTRG